MGLQRPQRLDSPLWMTAVVREWGRGRGGGEAMVTGVAGGLVPGTACYNAINDLYCTTACSPYLTTTVNGGLLTICKDAMQTVHAACVNTSW